MRYQMFAAGFLVALLCVTTPQAQENDPPKKEKKQESRNSALATLVQLGPGVHKIKTDRQGRIQSVIVIGQARISTVLGASKGTLDARTKSRLATEAEFVRWLKSEVEVHAKNEEETILFLEGNEGNDKDALRESGKSVEKTSQTFQTRAKGLVRGLQVLGVDVDSKNKVYTLVMGWSAKTANATKRVQADLQDDTPKTDGQGKGNTKTKGNKKIQDRKAVAPELDDFLK